MGAYFLDSSAYVKYFVREKGTDFIRALFDPNLGHDKFLCRLAGPELTATFARRHRNKDVSDADLSVILSAMMDQFGREVILFETPPAVYVRAMELARKYALKGADSVHLAAASMAQGIRDQLALTPLSFVSSDHELNLAASGEGFVIVDPENQVVIP